MSETVSPARSETKGIDAFDLLARFAPTIFLIALMLLFAFMEPRFLSSINLFNIMRQASITGLIAIGMTFVILTGGIDLSVGSLLALAGMITAYAYKGGGLLAGASHTSGIGVGGAILTACGVGVLCGLLQGLAITRLKVPPFIVTLGGLSIFRGLTLIVGGGGPISAFDAGFNWWGQGKIPIISDPPIAIPIPVILFLVFAIAAFVVLRYTQYGRYIYAVGGNPEAAR